MIKVIFDRRNKSSETVKGTVEIEVYEKKCIRRYISTGVSVYKGQFTDHVICCDNSRELNALIKKKKDEIENVLHQIEVDGKCSTNHNFDLYFKPKKDRYKNFFEFAYDEIELAGIRRNTKRQAYVAFEALYRFGKIKSFDSITPYNLELFTEFLKKENPSRVRTTLFGYHKRIKPYILKAFRLGLIDKNPYDIFVYKNGKYKDRKPLYQKEIDLLINSSFSPVLSRARDMFIFQTYTGLSYADMQNFSRDEVEFKEGINFIDGSRVKTGTGFYTPILPPAQKILDKYDYKLPVITNEKYNVYLHAIENILGINKPLTSHVARHTFATTIALAHDVPIEAVSKMLGHKDIKTTQVYAKVLKSTIERNVFEKMM
jgi:Site-specific recombinase XerD